MSLIVEECTALAKEMRAEMLDMADRVEEDVHWGGIFSCVEILAVLYHCVLSGQTEQRFGKKDKFLLSKGHAAFAVYTAMHKEKLMGDETYRTYRQNGSPLSELIHYDSEYGFEVSGGSLGLGVSYGAGLALLAKKKGYPYHTYVLVGDGEMDEGNVWEALMSAAQFKLDNLTVIVDANKLQLDGETKKIIDQRDLKSKFEDFGFDAREVDGHSCEELLSAFRAEGRRDCPRAIIADTIKGKGVSFMENDHLWHDKRLKGEELAMARREVLSN